MTTTPPFGTLPPEWAPQSATLLVWPHPRGDWANDIASIEQAYDEMAMAITQRQIALIVCYDSDHRRHVAERLTRRGCTMMNVRLYVAPTNDTWVRDSGPLTVVDVNGQPHLLNFQFNGWGGKYRAGLDNALTPTLAAQEAFGTDVIDFEMVLEGGSIDVNGTGSLLTTTACLLTPTRNPTLNRTQIEQRLKSYLNVSHVLWLEHGFLAGDDTDSHVDMLARFCDPNTLCYTACTDPRDEHYGELTAMAVELLAMRDGNDQPFRLIPLPWPQAKWNAEGERLPASYANFLFINGAVLVPTYDDPADATALQIFRAIFPDREIVAIPSLALIHQRGSVHCATMQLPVGVVL